MGGDSSGVKSRTCHLNGFVTVGRSHGSYEPATVPSAVTKSLWGSLQIRAWPVADGTESRVLASDRPPEAGVGVGVAGEGLVPGPTVWAPTQSSSHASCSPHTCILC